MKTGDALGEYAAHAAEHALGEFAAAHQRARHHVLVPAREIVHRGTLVRALVRSRAGASVAAAVAVDDEGFQTPNRLAELIERPGDVPEVVHRRQHRQRLAQHLTLDVREHVGDESGRPRAFARASKFADAHRRSIEVQKREHGRDGGSEPRGSSIRRGFERDLRRQRRHAKQIDVQHGIVPPRRS